MSQFDPGQYINPGPWRLPYHHYGILHYANRLGVALEPFIQVNYNAYVHSTNAYGGKPQRYREVQADFHGHVAELLAKTTKQNALDQAVTRRIRRSCCRRLGTWGALDEQLPICEGPPDFGFAAGPGWMPAAGSIRCPYLSEPDTLGQLLQSDMWRAIGWGHDYEYAKLDLPAQGRHGQIGKAFGIELGPLIQYNCKVIDIHQDDKGVTADLYRQPQKGGAPRTATADWCVCTIPASILQPDPDECGGQDEGGDQRHSLWRGG